MDISREHGGQRVALVTGGVRGIGRGACVALADAGFDIGIVSMEAEDEAAPVLAELRARGRLGHYVRQDIADLDRHAALVREIQDRVGAVDCLVNNAGVTSLVRGDLLQLSPASFDRSVAVNLRGTFFLTQEVARVMIAHPSRNYRSIVTVTSANADILGVERADYCMTKAGMSMLSKLYAARLAGEGIHVFEIRPGIIRTDMTAPATERYDRFIDGGGVPLGRWGLPADVGNVIATVAAGGLPFCTGEVINVGGGLQLHRV